MAKPRQLSSYKEYCTPDCRWRLTDPSESPRQVKYTLQKIYKLTKMAESKVNALHNVLMSESTIEQIKRRRSIPTTVSSRAAYSQRKVSHALTFLETQQSNIGKYYPVIFDTLRQAYHALTSLYNITQSSSVFAPLTKGKRSEQVLLIRDLAILAYGKLVDINIYVEKSIVSETTKETSSENNENCSTAPTKSEVSINEFVKQLRSKGWKITEEEKVDNKKVMFDECDGFSLSSQLIQLVKKPAEDLLPQDQLIGMIYFPILLQIRNKLTDTAIQVCTDSNIGYSLYVVFGNYLVIEQMAAIGIHKSIMKVSGERGTILDTDKFTGLLPYAKQEFPGWSKKLDVLHPSQPAKLRGAHYYCPLVPRGLLGENQINIQDWSFLQQ